MSAFSMHIRRRRCEYRFQFAPDVARELFIQTSATPSQLRSGPRLFDHSLLLLVKTRVDLLEVTLDSEQLITGHGR